ncbi:hypothetical protein [Limnobacter sp.]|uniref:tetratricopeptide repeat protein n=1 Tax=Limnobacter sp. TaxID=2003368 RepID=UPI0035162B9E
MNPGELPNPFYGTLSSLLAALLLWVGHPAWAATPPTNTPQQFEEGLRVYNALLEKARRGDPEIQTTLGLMRMQGEVVPQDLKVARVWLGKAALQNHVPAQFYLGQLLLLDVLGATPTDLNKQLTEGLGWLRRAAREQHKPAQFLYASTLLESQLAQPFGHSKIEAEQMLLLCADTHLPCTEYALKRLETDDSSETKRRLLYIMANHGDANAMFELASFANEDDLFWIRRAARAAHPRASFTLADLVLRGEVPLQGDDPALLALLNNAAGQGDPDAMHLLGVLLVEGMRLPVNRSLGLQWLNKAAQAGHEPAKAWLRDMPQTANTPTNPTFEVTPANATTEGTP